MRVGDHRQGGQRVARADQRPGKACRDNRGERLSRGHRHDLDALRSLAARDLRYIGLIGSKAKVKKIYDALIEEGMPLECLQRVHAPIGLDIGAVSPEEIAVSILAELIAVRRGRMEEPHVAAASLQWKKLPASLAPADKK